MAAPVRGVGFDSSNPGYADAFWGPAFWDGYTSGFYEPAFWEPAFSMGPLSTTGPTTAWSNVQLELSGTGNGWTDVSADVRIEDGIKAQYGIGGITATDRVAATGMMQFSLNNGPTNSARKVGYYSPDHVNCRTGFNYGIRVRLAMTFIATGTVYRFLGTLDQVRATPGVQGGYLTRCIAVDWIDEAARYHLTGLALETNVTGDEVFSAVVASVPIQPASIQTATGLDTYPYALDNVQDEKTTALQVFQNLAMSELGYIYIKSDRLQGGTLVYESRSTRGSVGTPVQTFSNTMSAVEPERSRANLLNKVQVTTHPRKVDVAPTAVLYHLDSATAVGPGASIIINAPYRDPNTGQYVRSGGVNMQAPAANTDWKANTAADGTGTDLTASFSVTATFTGNSAAVLVTNNSGSTGYIGGGTAGAFLQLRGQGIYDYNTAVLKSEDTTSQFQYGQRVINIDMPYQADPAVGNEAAQYVLNVWSNPLSYITKLQITGNWGYDLMRAVMLRDISDCIALDETVTGLKNTVKYFINAVEINIEKGRVFKAAFTLAPADQNSYWLLEVPGSSELGLTTRLGYGLIVGHIDLAHGDSHSDVLHGDIDHSDVSHTDVAHADATHGDSAHSDTAHADSHNDVSHGDVSHTDAAHSDSHSDVAHSDVAHSDFADHADNGVTVEHDDLGIVIIHVDSTTHTDSHADIAHSDSHSDTAHTDTAHQDNAHSDSHADASHSDVVHSDQGHVDTGHADVTHVDVSHADSTHGDSHADVTHGDVN